jgi:hypothetical protein
VHDPVKFLDHLEVLLGSSGLAEQIQEQERLSRDLNQQIAANEDGQQR